MKQPTPEERREQTARIRAEVGNEPLVSHAQDAVNAEVGGAVFERIPWDADHLARGGTIVNRWINEDAEVGVTTVNFRGRKGQVEVKTHRLILSKCEPPEAPSDYRCMRAARQLWAALGQRNAANGPPLDDAEGRYHGWSQALAWKASHHNAKDCPTCGGPT